MCDLFQRRAVDPFALQDCHGGLSQCAPPDQASWADAKKTVTLANGIQIAYAEMGDTAGRPRLLIHGFTDNSRSWSLVAPFLERRHVFAIDLRGHSKSSAPECCNGLTEFAYDASMFLDAVNIERADVVGQSPESLTAPLLAAQHSRQVNRIVLISITIRSGGGPGSWHHAAATPIYPNGQKAPPFSIRSGMA